MKALRISLFLLTVSVTIFACVNPPDYPDTPVIEYIGVNKLTVYQASQGMPADTLAISFSFTDGDGDLSLEDTTDIFLYDSRFPSVLYGGYKVPEIPLEGTGNGIRGEITVQIINFPQNLCCVDNGISCPDFPAIDVDTLSYTIQIRDRAGNFSNFIQTETIGILCQ